jgi:hypothetical protein
VNKVVLLAADDHTYHRPVLDRLTLCGHTIGQEAVEIDQKLAAFHFTACVICYPRDDR